MFSCGQKFAAEYFIRAQDVCGKLNSFGLEVLREWKSFVQNQLFKFEDVREWKFVCVDEMLVGEDLLGSEVVDKFVWIGSFLSRIDLFWIGSSRVKVCVSKVFVWIKS